MDPLSVTLTVVAFATAVKDLIELAQAICDAFAKAPQNYKNALRLASDILRTSKQIQTLYSNKKEILESTDELKDCLDELVQEMGHVRSECSRLIPPVSEKIRDRFKVAFYSFWDRNKVEDMVLGLKTHIDSIYRDFSLLSNIRTEATVNQISQAVNTGTVVRVQTTFQERYQGNFITFPGLSDARLAQFSQSHYTSMTRIDDTISDTDLYELVLSRELGKIEKLLGRSISRFLEDRTWEIQEVSPFQRTWRLHRPPAILGTAFHQGLIIDAFQLQSLIENANFSEINLAISSFSDKLISLRMFKQDLIITLWGVKFWRQIISSSLTNNSNAWAHLALNLTDAATSFSNIGDKDNAYAKSQEAIDIAQEKLDGNLLPEVQELVAQNLWIQADNTNASMPSSNIELATKAALTMDAAIDLRKTQAEQFNTLSGLDSSVQHDSLYTLLIILITLSHTQESQDFISEAHSTKKRALLISHSLLLEYPNSQLLLQNTATTVLDLCDSTFSDFNSLGENLAYAEEGTNIFRKLSQIDSPTNLINLSWALRSHREILLRAGMFHESERVFEEMITISQLISQRFQDHRLPSYSDSHYQFQLVVICYEENRSSEGVYAAYNAVEQYSALSFLNPNRSPLELIRVLAMLCEMLRKTNQHQSAVIEGFKALRLVDNAMETDQEIQQLTSTPRYFSLLKSIMKALAASSPDPSAVGKASALFARFKEIFFSSENSDYHSTIPRIYIEVLDKNGLVDDAMRHSELEDFLSAWGEKCSLSPSSDTAYSYLGCMDRRVDILKKHNRTEDALKCSKDAVAVFEQCSRHHEVPKIYRLGMFVVDQHSSLLCSVDLFKSALELYQAASLKFDSGKYPSGDIINPYIFHGRISLAQMQLYNYLPLQALETATRVEAVSRVEISKSQTDNPDFLFVLYRSMYVISSALFDLGRISESQVFLTQMKDGIQGRINDRYQSNIDEGNRLVLAMIARIFFVQSDYAQAKDMAFKSLEMDREGFEEEGSYFVQLASDLLFAGIASCCVNEHEAGVAVLAELEDLQQKISVTHPALANEVVFHLNMQAQRGQWKLIQTAARAKLTCNHVERALNLKMAWSNNSSGIEAVEE